MNGLEFILLFYVGKESEEFWKEGTEGVLTHHPKALVVVLSTAEATLSELLRNRLEFLKLERLAANEIGDGGDQINVSLIEAPRLSVDVARVRRRGSQRCGGPSESRRRSLALLGSPESRGRRL